MIVETVIHDVQTGKEEVTEVEETIDVPDTPIEPTLEEKVTALQEQVKRSDMRVLERKYNVILQANDSIKN